MSAATGNPLWAFSLDVYRRAEVASACLVLQDEAGADVNLVLFLMWCAASRRPLNAADIAEADARLAPWRIHVVEPLRQVRRAMKPGLLIDLETGCCRERVKVVELEAERLSQDALWALAPDPTNSGTDAAAEAEAYLAHYARHLDRPLPEPQLRTLIAASAQVGAA